MNTGHLLELVRQRLYGDEGGVTISDGSNIRIISSSTTDDSMNLDPETATENSSLTFQINGTNFQVAGYDES